MSPTLWFAEVIPLFGNKTLIQKSMIWAEGEGGVEGVERCQLC